VVVTPKVVNLDKLPAVASIAVASITPVAPVAAPIAAAITAATASATATRPSPATAATSIFAALDGPSFIHLEGTSFQILTVQGGDGGLSLGIIRHLDKAKPARLAGKLVFDNSSRGDLTVT
jgi:hypothetical protein